MEGTGPRTALHRDDHGFRNDLGARERPTHPTPPGAPGYPQVDLTPLLDGRRLWRASGQRETRAQGLPSGWAGLDAALPDGGWPQACLTEILHDAPGVGELALLLPALAQLGRERGGHLVWIAPPLLPYAPALAAAGLDLSRQLVIEAAATAEGAEDALWSMEQALASGACDAVLAWVEPRAAHWPRRLQLAAEQGGSWGLLFRERAATRRPSAAALRLQVEPDALTILKSRGGRPRRIGRA